MNFNQFYNFFKRKEKLNILLLFVAMFIASILEILGIGLIFPISGIILETFNTDTNKYTNLFKDYLNISSENLIFYSFLILLSVYFIKILFLIWYSFFQARFIFFFKEKISSSLFKNYLNQNFDFFHGRNSAEFLRNMTEEVDYFSNYLLSFLRVCLESLVIIFTICLLVFLNPIISFSVFSVFGIISIIYFYALRNKLSRWGKERQVNKKETLQFAQEGFESLNYIKFLGKENYFFKKFKEKNFGIAVLNIKANIVRELPRYIFEFIGIFSILMIFYIYFQKNVNTGEIIQILTVYVAASFRVLPSINKILVGASTMKFCAPSINILSDEFKNFKSEKEDLNGQSQINFNKNINLKIKNFKFKDKRDFDLSNINIEIEKNDKIGIIGKTGCGKSTIIQMIIGIIKGSEVEVCVDNKVINSQTRSWQNLICYVPQKIYVLDDTLKKNILFGKTEQEVGEEKIMSLVKITSLEKLVSQLPQGINTRIGEKGHNLSGGEIQRIAICRALLQEQQIIVLDEATSSLDDHTSEKIIKYIFELKNKTVIFVSHKYQSLKKCDKVYSVDKGKVEQVKSFGLN